MKKRNPYAKAVRKIRPQVVPDKRRKLAQRELAKITRQIHRTYPGVDV